VRDFPERERTIASAVEHAVDSATKDNNRAARPNT
jgi:hypothetical protein